MDRNWILKEIRRTAKSNNGKPLGQARFHAETGIRKYDWAKYWPRWGDAVKDAGLEPNQKTQAEPETVLLERLAAFVREIGHFPVYNELGIQSHNDSDFPSSKTWRTRFGGMVDLADKLKRFCEDRGFEDVAAICARRMKKERKPDSDAASGTPPHEPEPRDVIYLMKSGRRYKIGRTNSSGRREYELNIQSPEPVETIHVIKAIDDAPGLEAYWHRRFEDRRKHGEWFELTSKDVFAFKKRMKM